MGEIRPLERDDLEQAASRYQQSPAPALERLRRGWRSTSRRPSSTTRGPTRRSLHSSTRSRTAASPASSARAFAALSSMDGPPASASAASSSPTRRRADAPPGAFLMSADIKGAQDLTLTDTASDLVRRIWEGVGGDTFQLACVGWVRIFRPSQFASSYRARQERLGAPGRARPMLAGVDVATNAVLGRVLRPSGASAAEGRELTAGILSRPWRR